MDNFKYLTGDNFIRFAMHVYTNPQCKDLKEFEDDLSRIKYLKRLFRRYLKNGEIDRVHLRLCLNHLIVFCNVFPPPHGARMLFFKQEKVLWPILKTLLDFLGYMPDQIGEKERQSSAVIEPDKYIQKQLETL